MIGKRFGNYRAVSLLGEGGMGAVYLAEHPDIGRRVAVKVLRSELIRDPQLLLRFLNEARAANAIRHPNIIEILDSGTTPEGTPYLVMELLEGDVLAERIRRVGKVPLADALEFSYQTASALAAAHEKGIIHRDLKPDNLFIVPDPSDPTRERIKVLDFGIAKLQTFPTGGGMQTRTGTLMGTPVYMSPEQCLGTKTVDQRSDIYALGIIMYEMLAGRPPFLSEGFGELVNMHLNVKPTLLRQIDPTIPPAVEAMIAKALEKAPNARQLSAGELQLDIRAAAGKAILIRGVSSPDLSSGTLPGLRAGTAPTAHAFPSSTTLRAGSGERIATTMPVKRPSAARRILLGGFMAAAVVGVGIFAASRRGGSPGGEANGRVEPLPGTSVGFKAGDSPSTHGVPAPIGAPPQPATVRLAIDSQPSGATVTDVASGRSFGITPVVVERPSSGTAITARIEKPGYAAVTRLFSLDRDRTESVTLTRIPVPVAEPEAARPTASRQAEKTKKVARPHRPAAHADDEPAKL